MSWYKELQKDYKATWEAYKEAKAENNIEAMKSLSHDLVKIADAMESARDE